MMQTNGAKRQARFHTLRSFNIMLWVAFSLFAVALTFALTLIYHMLAERIVLDRANASLVDAREELLPYVTARDGAGIASIAYRYGVGGVYLVYEGEDGVIVYAGMNRTRRALDAYADLLSGSDVPVVDEDNAELVCAASLTVGGKACRLYLTTSLVPIDGYQRRFGYVSVISSLAAVVAAFATGGILAMLISRPVSEVTEEAKELARGNYAIEIRRNYFFWEIAELSDALDAARSEISKADRVQKELIANVSHDFKTPLTMIKAYASMIREISGEDKEKRDAHAQIIIEETDRLNALVSDVLDLSKIRAGGTEMRTVFDLSSEVRGILSRFDYLTETRGYVIEAFVDEGLSVRADRARIGQVVYNLVGNAVNYTGEDKRVRVKLFRKDPWTARLEVIDSGKGIPPEEVDTIWDRYYRSEGTHKRPVQGSGLGLSIVKNILLQHDTPFGVISEVGKGSCFWAEFRLFAAESPKEDLE